MTMMMMVDHSGFLLSLTTSRATLGDSWVLLSPLMVQSQQAISYLPPLVAFYDMHENTAVQFYSPRNRRIV